jgi:hypothetical protein
MICLPVKDRKEDTDRDVSTHIKENKIAMPQQHTQKGEHISQCHNIIFGKEINSQPHIFNTPQTRMPFANSFIIQRVQNNNNSIVTRCRLTYDVQDELQQKLDI